MANGISSVELVEAMSHAGMLGIFGAAGLPLRTVEAAIDRLTSSLGGRPFGFNLIYSPNEPNLEHGVVDLYLRHGVRLVEASAYMRLTLPLIRYRVSGIYRDTDGRVVTPNQVIAKASRVEVATRFFSPPSEAFLKELVASGDITEKQAHLAREVPVTRRGAPPPHAIRDRFDLAASRLPRTPESLDVVVVARASHDAARAGDDVVLEVVSCVDDDADCRPWTLDATYADRVIDIADGRVAKDFNVACGTPDDL